jgi:hypothetical protein
MTNRSGTGLRASALRVANIPGTTRIRLAPPSQTGMSIELSGPEAVLKDISWEIRGDTLHITGPESGGGGGTIISSFGSGDVFIGGRSVSVRGGRGVSVVSAGRQTVISTGGRGGTVIVDGKIVSGPGSGAEGGEPGEAELTVSVPEGTPVQIADNGDGTYEIGDTRGKLDLKLGGSSQVRAGHVDATRIAVDGHADIIIARVNGSFRVSISGSGRVQADGGEVGQLRLSISGSGFTGFAGTAADADLDVSGSGRIRVDTVTGSLNRDVSGSGSIDVRVQPRRSAGDFWS